jgi:hypothetical protein
MTWRFLKDDVQDTTIAEFALCTTPGHRQVRSDTCVKLVFRQLHGDRRASGILAEVLIMYRPHVENVDAHGRIQISLSATIG